LEQEGGAAMSGRKAEVWHVPGKWCWIRFEYAPEFREFLKASIPKDERSFDGERKAWRFTEVHFDAVMATAATFFTSIQIRKGKNGPNKSRPQAKQQQQDEPNTGSRIPDSREFVVLEFFNALPPAALKAAYHKAATLCHPDHGGSNDEMRYLNDLWAEIEKLSQQRGQSRTQPQPKPTEERKHDFHTREVCPGCGVEVMRWAIENGMHARQCTSKAAAASK